MFLFCRSRFLNFLSVLLIICSLVTSWGFISHYPSQSFIPKTPQTETRLRLLTSHCRSSIVSARTFGRSSRIATASFTKSNEDSIGQSTVEIPSTPKAGNTPTFPKVLDDDQIDFVRGYLNKHHATFLEKVAIAFSTSLSDEMAKANSFSGGSLTVESTSVTNINNQIIELQVLVQRRGKKDREVRLVEVSLDSNPIRGRFASNVRPIIAPNEGILSPIDDLARRLCRLAWIVEEPGLTGKLLQLAMQLRGAGVGKLPENLFLNQVPHNRYVRQWFYDKASTAVKDAVVLCSSGKITNRMRVVSKFPETNPTMDSYRIGTILELVRAIAIRLAEENLRVRVCVQESMGVGIFTGLPKQLSGVARLLQMMDWQSGEGEINAGMVGEYIRFGGVGKKHVLNTIAHKNEDGTETIIKHQDDVYLLIAPQSMVGVDCSIIPLLEEMTLAAGNRPVILINPDLTDKISSGGQQSVRGRQQRLDFDNSFQTVFHFQNIYISGTSYFPILGATTKLHPALEPWIAYQRRDLVNGDEVYVPVLADETLPDGASMMEAFER